jgi:hypothetical protein
VRVYPKYSDELCPSRLDRRLKGLPKSETPVEEWNLAAPKPTLGSQLNQGLRRRWGGKRFYRMVIDSSTNVSPTPPQKRRGKVFDMTETANGVTATLHEIDIPSPAT